MSDGITPKILVKVYEKETGNKYGGCCECGNDGQYLEWVEKELIKFINNSIHTIEMCKIINEDES